MDNTVAIIIVARVSLDEFIFFQTLPSSVLRVSTVNIGQLLFTHIRVFSNLFIRIFLSNSVSSGFVVFVYIVFTSPFCKINVRFSLFAHQSWPLLRPYCGHSDEIF